MNERLLGASFVLVAGCAALIASAPAAALTLTYDFSGTGHSAWDGEVDQSDANIANAAFPEGRIDWGADWQNWSEASAAEYAALLASDDDRYQSVGNPGFGDNVAHRFEFIVTQPSATVTDVAFSAEVSRARTTDDQYFYLWNYASSGYTVLGTLGNGSTDVSITDYSLVDNVAGIDASNIGEYVSAGGQVTLLSINQDAGGLFGGARWQRFDFIAMTVTSIAEPRAAVLLAFGALALGSHRQRARQTRA